MTFSIRDLETNRLADEVAAITGATKTGAVRQALRAERERLRGKERQRCGWAGGLVAAEAWAPTPARQLRHYRDRR